MVDLKKEGKIRYLGLSECSAATLRRAYKIHPIAAAQMESSPFALEIESEQTEFLKTARELGVKMVAYSPLGRGFLTGTMKSRKDLDEKDSRFNHARFSEENFGSNLQLVEKLGAMASKKGCTPGQLSLAWVLAQGWVRPVMVMFLTLTCVAVKTSCQFLARSVSSIWRRMLRQ